MTTRLGWGERNGASQVMQFAPALHLRQFFFEFKLLSFVDGLFFAWRVCLALAACLCWFVDYWFVIGGREKKND